MCLSRFHFPVLLGSTVVTRFTATMRTLTPDPLLQHRVSYPWFTNTHFQTFRLHPPHAPPRRQCFLLRADLATDSLVQLSAAVLSSLTPPRLVRRLWAYRGCVSGVVSAPA